MIELPFRFASYAFFFFGFLVCLGLPIAVSSHVLGYIDNSYTPGHRNWPMRSDGNEVSKNDELEDITVLKNLLELQSRLSPKTDSIEKE